METHTRKLGLLGGILLLVASGTSQASLITDPNLTYGDTNYLGLIDDGIPPSESNQVGYINNLNDLAAGDGAITIGSETYDRIDSTLAGPFEDAVLAGAIKDDGLDEVNNSTQQNGIYQYILGKYGGGAVSGSSLVWYNADGFTGDITLPGTSGPGGAENFGLSHISLFNTTSTSVPVPATLLLLGLGLLGLGGVVNRRR
jgi:hypothetical protein